MKSLKVYGFVFFALMLFLGNCSVWAQIVQPENSADNEVIKVETKLVRQAFIAPWQPVTYEVYSGSRKLEDFRIITPQNESEIGWVLVLDLNSKNQPSNTFSAVKRHLKKISKTLTAPTIIINTENIALEVVKDKLNIPADWTVFGALNLDEAWLIAEKQVAKTTANRKALFVLSSSFKGITRTEFDKLPTGLRNKEIFTYFATIKESSKAEKGIQIAMSNLSLNTSFRAIGKSGFVDLHFKAFLDQCSQLNLVFYETESAQEGEFKIFAKSGGVETRQMVQQKIVK